MFQRKYFIQATNTEYGGVDIKVDNVVFVHGSVDPWHAMGVINTTTDSAPAIYIAGDFGAVRNINI